LKLSAKSSAFSIYVRVPYCFSVKIAPNTGRSPPLTPLPKSYFNYTAEEGRVVRITKACGTSNTKSAPLLSAEVVQTIPVLLVAKISKRATSSPASSPAKTSTSAILC
jgi:hypothetical protein